MKSILDRAFVYTSAAATTPEYLRAKLRRYAKELKEREMAQKPAAKVTTLARKERA